MSNRKQRRMEQKRQSLSNQLQYTTNTSDEYFRLLATKALKGELSADEWSRLSPALRKKLDRFSKKVAEVARNTDLLQQLPADAIIKDINLNENSEQAEDQAEKND